MPKRTPTRTATVLTVGHSNRSLEEFLHLLQAHQATLVVDVRKMPRSRNNPQFNGDTLPQALHEAGIGYLHMPGLGGLRRRQPNSPNTGWKNTSFQGYAERCAGSVIPAPSMVAAGRTTRHSLSAGLLC